MAVRRSARSVCALARVCLDYLAPFRLAPGESDQFQISYPAPPQAIEHFAIRLWLEQKPEPSTAVPLLAVAN